MNHLQRMISRRFSLNGNSSSSAPGTQNARSGTVPITPKGYVPASYTPGFRTNAKGDAIAADPDMAATLPEEIYESIRAELQSMPVNGFRAQDELLSLLRFQPKEGVYRATEYFQLLIIALILFSTISLPTFIVPSDHMAGLIKDGHVAATLAHFLLGAISLMTMFTAASLILITNLIVSYPAHRIRPRLARARKLFGVPVQLLLLVTIYLFPAVILLIAFEMYDVRYKVAFFIVTSLIVFVLVSLFAIPIMVSLAPLHIWNYLVPFSGPFIPFFGESLKTLKERAVAEMEDIARDMETIEESLHKRSLTRTESLRDRMHSGTGTPIDRDAAGKTMIDVVPEEEGDVVVDPFPLAIRAQGLGNGPKNFDEPQPVSPAASTYFRSGSGSGSGSTPMGTGILPPGAKDRVVPGRSMLHSLSTNSMRGAPSFRDYVANLNGAVEADRLFYDTLFGRARIVTERRPALITSLRAADLGEEELFAIAQLPEGTQTLYATLTRITTGGVGGITAGEAIRITKEVKAMATGEKPFNRAAAADQRAAGGGATPLDSISSVNVSPRPNVEDVLTKSSS